MAENNKSLAEKGLQAALKEFGVKDISELSDSARILFEREFKDELLYGYDFAATLRAERAAESSRKLKETNDLIEKQKEEQRQQQKIDEAITTARKVCSDFRDELRELRMKYHQQLISSYVLNYEVNDKITRLIIQGFLDKEYGTDEIETLIRKVFDNAEINEVFQERYGFSMPI